MLFQVYNGSVMYSVATDTEDKLDFLTTLLSISSLRH